LVLAKVADSPEAARERLLEAWRSGAALQRFQRMVSALGGPDELCQRPADYLPAAPIRFAVWAQACGYVIGIDTRTVGLAVVALGGGRLQPQDTVDPAVGFSDLALPGEAVGEQRPLGWVHARTQEAALAAANALRGAYRLGDEPGVPAMLVVECVE
jgi:thymidine phosphorylase